MNRIDTILGAIAITAFVFVVVWQTDMEICMARSNDPMDRYIVSSKKTPSLMQHVKRAVSKPLEWRPKPDTFQTNYPRGPIESGATWAFCMVCIGTQAVLLLGLTIALACFAHSHRLLIVSVGVCWTLVATFIAWPR